uniref:Ankyrin repeat domain-containing protein n=1 Tax=Pygocentrus nattereri TaxID=42514 RepID=A0AAR2IRC2_PYGNA
MISAKKTPEKSRYRLHYLVWHNKHRQLEKELSASEQVLDPRGRTPLHLAVTLGHLESARVLLNYGADVSKENSNGWTVLQEAISRGDPELVRLVLRHRDYQRTSKRLAGIPRLLERLQQAQDFYVEMKWEFTSWVPLVSRICPSDTYRVWKSGQCLRVDTTLMGFEQMTWQRGNRSFIFKGQDSSAMVMEVDHDRQLVFCETLPCLPSSPSSRPHPSAISLLGALQPSDEQVAARLSAPVVTTQLDTRNISFERNKTGILGWRSEKTEVVNGYEAKVYCASNVELITRTRTDHLTEQNKTKSKGGKTPLQSFLGIAEQHMGTNNGQTLVTQMSCPVTNPCALTAEEYFNPSLNHSHKDIGQPCHLTTKTQRFKAKLWLCESHPLSLADQVAPIIDLMAISNALFAKLRDFITLRLPPGFPVKIEIPIYHILNARITFENLNGCEEGVVGRMEGEDGQKDSPRAETPSPGSDSSSVSSSSSTSEHQSVTHTSTMTYQCIDVKCTESKHPQGIVAHVF